jgi:hypothetical protein
MTAEEMARAGYQEASARHAANTKAGRLINSALFQNNRPKVARYTTRNLGAATEAMGGVDMKGTHQCNLKTRRTA